MLGFAQEIAARATLRLFARIVPPERVTTEELLDEHPELSEVVTEDVDVAGPHGSVPVRLYRRRSIPPRVGFVWVHGGAFIFGDLDFPEAHWVSLALAARGISVASVDYRKALGRTRFPAMSDDVLAAWNWVSQHPERLGVEAQNLHLGGASAGANLSAGVAKRLRDSSDASPASLVLAYPLAHYALPTLSAELQEALTRNPPPFRFTPGVVAAINLNWAGRARSQDPIAFPALGSLEAMPPTLILNAESDELRSSGEDLGRLLSDAGSEVVVETAPATFHGFLANPALDAATTGLDRITRWLDAR